MSNTRQSNVEYLGRNVNPLSTPLWEQMFAKHGAEGIRAMERIGQKRVSARRQNAPLAKQETR
jgi:hypothetical protein